VNISEFFDSRSRSVTERLIFGMDWPQTDLEKVSRKGAKEDAETQAQRTLTRVLFAALRLLRAFA
jgi:predicted TIM-barrel fold metal-dependent hydrolase